jgi:hypothetical protein
MWKSRWRSLKSTISSAPPQLAFAPAHLQRIIGDINHRAAMPFLNMPHEEKVDGVEIIAAITAARAKEDQN